ncbi:uncharacterized protein N7496_011571 [Penicillium cataractarum]|uniref:Uncharacterized protein n=1 Tax=Penicillium cataractarum TaxID=2100454 RepID=A0A9W9RKE4_9EURO|nr:uncharacterized protein N7496_011571 [Penicillium cataractarum]KAJ5359158.1 hypothetical protein N7496_011571 [Penicillium cataractarum]
MSTVPPRTPDRSVLGDSWIVASTASIKDQSCSSTPSNDPGSPTPAPRTQKQVDTAKPANKIANPKPNPDQNQYRDQTKLSDSLTSSTSSWSMSGPELVMPSIYEVPISEASWVAPHMRSADPRSPHMRKRRKITPSGQQKQQSSSAPEASDAGLSAPGHAIRKPSVISKLSSLYHKQRTLLRTAINTLLIALIMHLLILPELIYQAQDLCTLPTIQSTYPASCIPLHPRALPSNPFHSASIPISPEETIIAAQTSLQDIFTTTLSTLTPLAYTLKDSESTLSTLQTNLQTSLPDARHALALEFQGSDAALRAAAWEFDSLRADLRSAVDSLLASPLALESGGAASIARDTRLAAQLRRRAEYLDRLRAQLRSKAESLGGRFATLDDHLEAIDGIVSREARRASLLHGDGDHADTAGQRGEGLLHSLSSYAGFSARLFGAGSSSSSSSDSNADSHDQSTGPSPAALSNADRRQPTSTLALLRLAATQHRAVADEVARLAKALRDEQRARLGPTW